MIVAERLLTELKAMRGELAAYGVAHAAVFGSVARSQAGPASDVDIVVDPANGQKIGLWALGGLRDLICERLGTDRIDVIATPIAHPALAQAVERDRVAAF